MKSLLQGKKTPERVELEEVFLEGEALGAVEKLFRSCGNCHQDPASREISSPKAGNPGDLHEDGSGIPIPNIHLISWDWGFFSQNSYECVRKCMICI